MTWGAMYMCYECPKCGKKFRSATDMIAALGDSFGKCPVCGTEGKLVLEGPISKEIQEYEEIED
mgnify:CR=1 FL=1|jgi:diphthamide biosynthesis protein 3